MRTRLRVVATELSSRAERDELLQSSLFSYGFRPYQSVGFASTSRIVASLMQSVPVLQERVTQTTLLVDALEIVDGADDVLTRWDDLLVRRQAILDRQMAAWRAMPAAAIMAAAIAVMRPARDHGPIFAPRPSLLERSVFARNLARRIAKLRAS